MEDRNSKIEKELNIQITPAEVRDVHDIQDVFYKTWLTTYPNKQYGISEEDIEDRFKDRYAEERLAKRRGDLEKASVDRKIFVARDGSRVVGLCRVEKHPEHNQLSAMYVLPEYQGKGLGYKLWQEAKKFLDPKNKTIVHVVTYNQPAIDFYTRLGFVDTHKHFTDERFRLKSGATLPEMEMVLERLED